MTCRIVFRCEFQDEMFFVTTSALKLRIHFVNYAVDEAVLHCLDGCHEAVSIGILFDFIEFINISSAVPSMPANG